MAMVCQSIDNDARTLHRLQETKIRDKYFTVGADFMVVIFIQDIK